MYWPMGKTILPPLKYQLSGRSLDDNDGRKSCTFVHPLLEQVP